MPPHQPLAGGGSTPVHAPEAGREAAAGAANDFEYARIRGGSPWMLGVGPGFVKLKPSTNNNTQVGIITFFVAPIALLLAQYATVSMLKMAAYGQPLSSSLGLIYAFLSAVLMLGLGYSTAFSTAGMTVTAVWATALSLLTLLSKPLWLASGASAGSPPNDQSQVLTVFFTGGAAQWCQLQVLFAVIATCAAIAAYFVRYLRVLEVRHAAGFPLTHREQRLVSFQSGDAAWWSTVGQQMPRERQLVHIFTFAVTLLGGVLIWLSAYLLSPSNIDEVSLFGPFVINLFSPNLFPLLVLTFSLAVIVLLTICSSFGAVFVAWVGFAAVGIVLLPMWASLTGNVATSGSAVNTSLAFAAPVVGILGLVVGSLSVGIHLVRTGPLSTPEIEAELARCRQKFGSR